MTGRIRSWARQLYGAIPLKRKSIHRLHAAPDLPPFIYQHLHSCAANLGQLFAMA